MRLRGYIHKASDMRLGIDQDNYAPSRTILRMRPERKAAYHRAVVRRCSEAPKAAAKQKISNDRKVPHPTSSSTLQRRAHHR